MADRVFFRYWKRNLSTGSLETVVSPGKALMAGDLSGAIFFRFD